MILIRHREMLGEMSVHDNIQAKQDALTQRRCLLEQLCSHPQEQQLLLLMKLACCLLKITTFMVWNHSVSYKKLSSREVGFSCIEEIFVLFLKLEWVAFGGSEFPISRKVQERGHEIRQDVLTDTLILCLWLWEISGSWILAVVQGLIHPYAAQSDICSQLRVKLQLGEQMG